MSMADPAEMRTPPDDRRSVARLTVVPRRQYGIWIGTVLALLLAFVIVRAFASNPAFAWDTAFGYLFHPSIMRGLRHHADPDRADHGRRDRGRHDRRHHARVAEPDPARLRRRLCLVLPRRAGADPADLLVQPVAAGARDFADPALRRHAVFGAHQRFHVALLLGRRGAVAVRGGLHGGNHPRRHQVGAERPGRGGERARHALPHDPQAHHPAPGHALRRAADRQRGDQPSQDDVAGDVHRGRRPVLFRPEHLCPHLRDDPAADRRGLLVSRRGQHHVVRPAFPRAAFRPQRQAQRTHDDDRRCATRSACAAAEPRHEQRQEPTTAHASACRPIRWSLRAACASSMASSKC